MTAAVCVIAVCATAIILSAIRMRERREARQHEYLIRMAEIAARTERFMSLKGGGA